MDGVSATGFTPVRLCFLQLLLLLLLLLLASMGVECRCEAVPLPSVLAFFALWLGVRLPLLLPPLPR